MGGIYIISKFGISDFLSLEFGCSFIYEGYPSNTIANSMFFRISGMYVRCQKLSNCWSVTSLANILKKKALPRYINIPTISQKLGYSYIFLEILYFKNCWKYEKENRKIRIVSTPMGTESIF